MHIEQLMKYQDGDKASGLPDPNQVVNQTKLLETFL